jgi:O-antigen/teichoic acid export membrane protein
MIKKIKNTTYNLLRWSEKFFKTDMVYLFKGGLWINTSTIIGSLTSLALAIAYAKLLPKEDYGLYKYALSIVGLLSLVAMPGINTAIYRSISLGAEGSFREALKLKLRWGALAALAGFLVAGYYFINGNNILAIGIAVASLFVPFREAVLLANVIISGKKKFKDMGIYNSIQQILLALTLISALFFFKKIVIFLIIYFIAYFISDFLFYLKVTSKYKLNDKIDPEMKNFSKHMSLLNIIGAISDQLDKILMWHFFGAKELAIYSFATIPTTQIKGYLKSIFTLAFPKLAVQNDEITKKTLPAKIFKLTLIVAVGIIAYIFLAPFFYKLLFPQYLESINYSRLYFLTLLFFPVTTINQLLIARAKKRDLYMVQFLTPAVKIISLIALVPIMGIYGAIYAQFIATMAGAILLYYFFRKL